MQEFTRGVLGAEQQQQQQQPRWEWAWLTPHKVGVACLLRRLALAGAGSASASPAAAAGVRGQHEHEGPGSPSRERVVALLAAVALRQVAAAEAEPEAEAEAEGPQGQRQRLGLGALVQALREHPLLCAAHEDDALVTAVSALRSPDALFDFALELQDLFAPQEDAAAAGGQQEGAAPPGACIEYQSALGVFARSVFVSFGADGSGAGEAEAAADHYGAFARALGARDSATAADELHLFLDHHRPLRCAPGAGGCGGAPMLRPRGMLALAGMHARLGQRDLALRALAEAVSVAQELSSDTRPADACIAEGLWLRAELAPTAHQREALLRRAYDKAAAAALPMQRACCAMGLALAHASLPAPPPRSPLEAPALGPAQRARACLALARRALLDIADPAEAAEAHARMRRAESVVWALWGAPALAEAAPAPLPAGDPSSCVVAAMHAERGDYPRAAAALLPPAAAGAGACDPESAQAAALGRAHLQLRRAAHAGDGARLRAAAVALASAACVPGVAPDVGAMARACALGSAGRVSEAYACVRGAAEDRELAQQPECLAVLARMHGSSGNHAAALSLALRAMAVGAALQMPAVHADAALQAAERILAAPGDDGVAAARARQLADLADVSAGAAGSAPMRARVHVVRAMSGLRGACAGGAAALGEACEELERAYGAYRALGDCAGLEESARLLALAWHRRGDAGRRDLWASRWLSEGRRSLP
eukprot:m51a1_g7080 hypothetical protein (717) ;mRNA; f:1144-3474